MISLSVSLIWLLAMLGAAAHLRDSDRTAGNAAWVAASFVVAMPLASWLSPQPNWIAVLVGVAAVWRLIDGPLPRAGLVLSGGSAGLGAALVATGGVPIWQAAGLTALALAAAFVLRGRRAAGVQHEGLLVLVALAAPVVGLAGDLVFGWHSATMLNQEGGELDFIALPGWTIAIVVAALLAGLVRGLWIRR